MVHSSMKCVRDFSMYWLGRFGPTGTCSIHSFIRFWTSILFTYNTTCFIRPNVKDCEQAYEIYGSASELEQQECDEIKYENLCKFRTNKKGGKYNLECDWSICFPRKPYIGEVSSTYGMVVKWLYSPSDGQIERIIHRSIKNGFNFVFFKCGSLRQVLLLPRTLKLSSRKNKKQKMNVNIILVDSISRPHFYRSMPRTIEALRHVVYNKSIPATVLDFELFQSVSQHTMDNCRPLYSGVTSGNQKYLALSSFVSLHDLTL